MRSTLTFTLGATLALAACGDDAPVDDPGPDAADPTAQVVPLAIECGDTFETLYTLPGDLPAYDESRRGDVVRCALDRAAGAAAIDAQARAFGYDGPTLDSGATVYRVAYRTERAPDAEGGTREAVSSALLLVPSVPRGDGATIVYAHPAVGIAETCAPSRQDPLATPDAWAPALGPLVSLVGAGFTVIAPDYAGYGFGQPPGFAYGDDVARSVLDATRAAAEAVRPAERGETVTLVGHSQGGHAVLSAHALDATYGHEGELVGVVGLAPLWITPWAWGAILSDFAGFDTTRDAYVIQYAMDYFYSRSELTDGVGSGALLFQAEKRDAAVELLVEHCINDVAMMLPTLGEQAVDFFEPTFANVLGVCGVSGTCTDEPAATWEPRFAADRPHLAPGGPPILLWFSGGDGTITPGFGQCAMDRLTADVGDAEGALTACMAAESVHTQVPIENLAWVTEWIAARALGEAAPAASGCPALVDDEGQPPVCTTPPPNL